AGTDVERPTASTAAANLTLLLSIIPDCGDSTQAPFGLSNFHIFMRIIL
ncbi:hypothetical protein HUU51_03040, partial [Candidatus Gracilibacteria bacterium]|nr:hypothetical protein [Candidatus Gracilibacteria bacterium]